MQKLALMTIAVDLESTWTLHLQKRAKSSGRNFLFTF